MLSKQQANQLIAIVKCYGANCAIPQEYPDLIEAIRASTESDGVPIDSESTDSTVAADVEDCQDCQDFGDEDPTRPVPVESMSALVNSARTRTVDL